MTTAPPNERPEAPRKGRRLRGFEAAAGLVKERIRAAGESRGFAVARLITHWTEVVGPEIAATARPVKIGYGREGFGATLTLLVEGPMAPMIDMQREQIRAKVNACYGYNAISRIHITQTAATGFAEGQVAFAPAPKTPRPQPSPEVKARAHDATEGLQDTGLRDALEQLGRNIYMKPAPAKPDGGTR
ncbi:uncharacterized protein DUF721 [Rhodobacter aestuarii]|uniref:DUF721 domain-containing protein n=1 Tax=Rhodobacter aestuarii TaxID=453582 RepID=A0A1N7PSI2_9RHOB|nr:MULTISPECIES: DciA family protein [Rhodobacter]PTV94198.1 uncharacterized protein DUF721 [Rhodobacter aestuarii]SIT13561.1 Protein of unknown function [Rhodobacter aestuarii]SOC19045.1 uncharacterized protein DUF721 [Rhodobacter sp. JA431]